MHVIKYWKKKSNPLNRWLNRLLIASHELHVHTVAIIEVLIQNKLNPIVHAASQQSPCIHLFWWSICLLPNNYIKSSIFLSFGHFIITWTNMLIALVIHRTRSGMKSWGFFFWQIIREIMYERFGGFFLYFALWLNGLKSKIPIPSVLLRQKEYL